MFFGILIYMYYDEHQPPHFHARYQGEEAEFFLDGELLSGKLPKRQMKLIAAWAELHSEELAANWEVARTHDELFRIEPLR